MGDVPQPESCLSSDGFLRLPPEFEKTVVFNSCFLWNSEKFLNFAKSSKKFGEFLNFLEFSKIIDNSLVLSYVFLNFLDFPRMLEKIKEHLKSIEKYLKILKNFKKF